MPHGESQHPLTRDEQDSFSDVDAKQVLEIKKRT